MVDSEERDLVEGRYTQAEPEAAEPRKVHGRYTGTSDDDPAETEQLGAYVGAQHDGEPPLVRSTHQRIGDYPRAEHDPARSAADDASGDADAAPGNPRR